MHFTVALHWDSSSSRTSSSWLSWFLEHGAGEHELPTYGESLALERNNVESLRVVNQCDMASRFDQLDDGREMLVRVCE